MKPIKKYKLNILFLMGSIVVSIILAETVLQIINVPEAAFSGWRNKRGDAETNQLGFRGQKINYSDDDYVVMLVGDSQVAAAACLFDNMPERRLEYHLKQSTHKKNIKVFSIGGIGYGQDQELLILKNYFKTYRADLVVLWLTPFNDVWNNVFPTHWPKNGRPKPTFWLENNRLQGPSEQMGETFGWSKFKLFALANRQFHLIDRDGNWEKHLPEAYKPLADYKGKICNDWQSKWDNRFGLMRDENLATEKSHFAMSLTPVSMRTRYGMDLTRQLLKEFDALTANNKGKFIIFDAKLPPNPADSVCVEDEVVHSLNGKYYKTSWKQFNDNWSYIKAGFSSFTIPVTTANWRVDQFDEHHLNEMATDQVMSDLSKYILPLIM